MRSSGVEVDEPVASGANREWRALYDEYERRGAPVGAQIPGE
jgi:hypothetical protein